MVLGPSVRNYEVVHGMIDFRKLLIAILIMLQQTRKVTKKLTVSLMYKDTDRNILCLDQQILIYSQAG